MAKQNIAEEIVKLKNYESNFQFNYPFNIFIDTKKDEIFNIFDANNNGGINIAELKNTMSIFAPKEISSKWNKWK